MQNLSRGFLRLWLFFSLLWVSFCAYQVWDAKAELKQAEALLGYYAKSSAEAKTLEGRAGASPVVSAHLVEQVQQNTTTIAQQKSRAERYAQLLWQVPLITLVFARGIPWVVNGFLGR